jgi:glutamate dehydrogenase/leucine dehydrogenase
VRPYRIVGRFIQTTYSGLIAMMTAAASHCSQSPRVSIIGAGNVGSTLGQRLVEKNLADVVLLVGPRPDGSTRR